MQQLIDGVGDEVVQFAAAVALLLVAILAWISTNAHPDRYRTVLVMRSRSHHPVTVNIHTRSDLMVTSSRNTSSVHNPASSEGVTADTSPSSNSPSEESPRENARVIPLQEMDSIVDADVAMLDNNRLHFYRRIESLNNSTDSTSEESEAQEESEPSSNAQMREMDSIVNAMEAEVTTGCDFFTRSNATNSTISTIKDGASTEHVNNADDLHEDSTDGDISDQTPEEREASKILIKLKYLNDTLKEVEGNLDELLKDFKIRHFSTELSSEARVRLIFNGRVLCDEGATLRACGLHHHAIVHCLVHPKRTGTRAVDQQQRGNPEEMNGNATHELITERAQPDRSWDFENILMTLVSIALTVVWFFRCEYANMFTASASVALFGLTIFYSVAIFGLYLSDTFQFDRRPAQPQTPATTQQLN